MGTLRQISKSERRMASEHWTCSSIYVCFILTQLWPSDHMLGLCRQTAKDHIPALPRSALWFCSSCLISLTSFPYNQNEGDDNITHFIGYSLGLVRQHMEKCLAFNKSQIKVRYFCFKKYHNSLTWRFVVFPPQIFFLAISAMRVEEIKIYFLTSHTP